MFIKYFVRRTPAQILRSSEMNLKYWLKFLFEVLLMAERFETFKRLEIIKYAKA
jgi:hypothetical protein